MAQYKLNSQTILTVDAYLTANGISSSEIQMLTYKDSKNDGPGSPIYASFYKIDNTGQFIYEAIFGSFTGNIDGINVRIDADSEVAYSSNVNDLTTRPNLVFFAYDEVKRLYGVSSMLYPGDPSLYIGDTAVTYIFKDLSTNTQVPGTYSTQNIQAFREFPENPTNQSATAMMTGIPCPPKWS